MISFSSGIRLDSIESRQPVGRMKVVIVVLLVHIAGADPASDIKTAVCSKKYTLNCFTLDLMELVARTGGDGKYQLLPGIFLSHNLTAHPPPPDLLRAVQTGNATQRLEEYLNASVNEYLSSVTLSVQVLDSSTTSHARTLTQHILTSLMSTQSGRGKKETYGAAAWAAGTIAAVGMAGLAAISGKAMMASMLALMMAGTSALRSGNGNSNGGGNGGGCKSTHYIDANGRAIERSAVVEPFQVYSDVKPIYNQLQLPHDI